MRWLVCSLMFGMAWAVAAAPIRLDAPLTALDGKTVIMEENGDPSFGVAFAEGSVAKVVMTNGAVHVRDGNMQVAGRGTGILEQRGGTVTVAHWCVIGRWKGAKGTYIISGGTFNQWFDGFGLVIGEEGDGTVIVQGEGVANLTGGLFLSGGKGGGSGRAVVSLRKGGVINTPSVGTLSGTNSRFEFDGGTLRVRGSGRTNLSFMQGLAEAVILPGGAIIDTGDNEALIYQPLSGEGGMVKRGKGTLILAGKNRYGGKTVVEEGLLRFSGDESLPQGVLEVRRGARIDFGGRTVAVDRITGDGVIADCVLMNAAGKKRRVVLASLENDPTFEGGSE